MSRIGKMIIEIPSNVNVENNKETNTVTSKGPKGELSLNIPEFISISRSENILTLSIADENNKKQKSCWGTYRALINNMIIGVSDGFTREMELNGVGYKMELSGNTLKLYIGYSHPVILEIPSNLKINLNKNLIQGESINKQDLGDFFMKIHNMKPCDVYKQKGFKIPGRFYRKKVGKKAK